MSMLNRMTVLSFVTYYYYTNEKHFFIPEKHLPDTHRFLGV